jgi:hypothetical protein
MLLGWQSVGIFVIKWAHLNFSQAPAPPHPTPTPLPSQTVCAMPHGKIHSNFHCDKKILFESLKCWVKRKTEKLFKGRGILHFAF